MGQLSWLLFEWINGWVSYILVAQRIYLKNLTSISWAYPHFSVTFEGKTITFNTSGTLCASYQRINHKISTVFPLIWKPVSATFLELWLNPRTKKQLKRSWRDYFGLQFQRASSAMVGKAQCTAGEGSWPVTFCLRADVRVSRKWGGATNSRKEGWEESQATQWRRHGNDCSKHSQFKQTNDDVGV